MWNKHVKQHDKRDCGAACLATICNYNGIKTTLVEARELSCVDKQGVSVYGISQAAEKQGLIPEALEGTIEELIAGINNKEFRFPIIAHIITKQNLGHYIIIKKYINEKFHIFDPAKGNYKIQKEVFNSMWTGVIVAFEKKETIKDKKSKEKRNSTKIYFEVLACEWKKIFLTFALSIAISIITMLGAWVYRIVIDYYVLHIDSTEKLISNHNIWIQQIEIIINNFKFLFIALIGVYIFQATLLFLRGQILNHITKNMNKALSLKFYEHLLRLPLNFFERRESGEIITRYQSIIDLQELLIDTLLTIILETIMAVAGGIILAQINLFLFMLVVIMVISYAILTLCFIKPLKNYSRRLQESDADVTTFFNESIDCIERIKADVVESKFSIKFASRVQILTQNIYKLSKWQNLISSIVVCIESIGILFILWKGSDLVIKGIISLGTLIAFESLVQFFVTPIKNLINVQVTIHNLIIIINRLNDVLDVKREGEKIRCDEEELNIGNQIVLKNIKFSYGYQEPIFNDLNIHFASNAKYGIVGKSGSGKSTLLKLIAILEKPQKGNIIFGKTDSNKVDEFILRNSMSYVSQTPHLFSGTIKENLYLNEERNDKEYENIIFHVTGMSELMNNLPGGKEFVITENGNNLSGGQKQKISLAKALLRRPQILILDEATSSLDGLTEKKVFQFLNKNLPNTTIIATFHNLDLAKYFDYIIFLEEGKIIASGEHKKLIEENNSYKKFFSFGRE